MRPTPSEQLNGMRRILDDVVRPHVDDAYAAEQLKHVMTALTTLAEGWDDVVPALVHDNAELAALLRGLIQKLERVEVSSTLVSRLRAVASAGNPKDFHFDPQHARHQDLRAEISTLIVALDAVPDQTTAEPIRSTIGRVLRNAVED